MLGFSLEKILLLLVLIAALVGPDRMPYWAARLRQQVRIITRVYRDAKGRVGAELDDAVPEWREYDPRRLRRPDLRALLMDSDGDEPSSQPQTQTCPAASQTSPRPEKEV